MLLKFVQIMENNRQSDYTLRHEASGDRSATHVKLLF